MSVRVRSTLHMGKNAKQSYFVKQSSAMIVIDKVTSQSICKIDVWPNKPFPTILGLIKPLLILVRNQKE